MKKLILYIMAMSVILFGNEDNDVVLNNATKYVNGKYVKKNYKKAEKILVPLCKKKVRGSCYLLGRLYFNGGYGLEKNITKHNQYRKLSCNNGSGFACYNMAKDFFEKNEDKKAIVYLQESCDNNFTKGCQSLGLIYGGKGVEKDYNKSMYFYKKACILNDALSCYSQAIFYLKGFGVEKNFSKTLNFFSKACKLKDAESCYSLASMYYYGKYTKKDHTKAIELYKRAYELTVPRK